MLGFRNSVAPPGLLSPLNFCGFMGPNLAMNSVPPPGSLPMGGQPTPPMNMPPMNMPSGHLPPPMPMNNGPSPPYLEFRVAEMNRRLDAFHHNRNSSELHFYPRTTTERFLAQPGMVPFGAALDCEQAELHLILEKPLKTEVRTVARFLIEFGLYEEMFGYRIRHFCIDLRHTQEKDQKRPPLTIFGLPPNVIGFLKMSEVLEPMKHIMGYAKTRGGVNPKEAMKMCVFDWHQKNSNPPPHPQNAAASVPEEPPVKPKATRKRTRKTPAANGAPAQTPAQKKKAAAAAQQAQQATVVQQSVPNGPPGLNQPPFQPAFNMQMPTSHEVMVVSEPSMMGADYVDEDERSISRVENAQYDQNANSTTMHTLGEGGTGMLGPSQMGMGQSGVMLSNQMMPPHSALMNGS